MRSESNWKWKKNGWWSFIILVSIFPFKYTKFRLAQIFASKLIHCRNSLRAKCLLFTIWNFSMKSVSYWSLNLPVNPYILFKKIASCLEMLILPLRIFDFECNFSFFNICCYLTQPQRNSYLKKAYNLNITTNFFVETVFILIKLKH